MTQQVTAERVQRPRGVERLVNGPFVMDGAGVKINRVLTQPLQRRLDPFLMLDAFGTDNPQDYVGGFPDHPHRGFETVTYLLDGHMLHEDHLGNRGDLKSGGVQWMTAGRGIIHSEMPQQLEGRMRGFQLWLNLPAREKMKAAGYRDIEPSEIPAIDLPDGGRAKVIAGAVEIGGKRTEGPIHGGSTDPLYVDVEIPAGATVSLPVAEEHNAFVYVFEGSLSVGEGEAARPLENRSAGILSQGDRVSARAGAEGARFLLLAGKPLREPIVQYGPFVMNTREEIEQAINDYQSGALTA